MLKFVFLFWIAFALLGIFSNIGTDPNIRISQHSHITRINGKIISSDQENHYVIVDGLANDDTINTCVEFDKKYCK